MAAWNIFGRDTTPEQLPAELRSILAEMKRERVAFEALTTAARDSGQNLSQLMQPVTEAQKVVSELQGRVKSLERLVPVLATLDEQTENVSKSQRRTETQLTQNSESAKLLRSEIDELRGVLEQALALKNDVAGFLELGGGFKALRMDADTLSGAVRELTQGFDQVRARQEEVRKTSEAVSTRLSAFEDRQQGRQRSVAETESRTATVGQTLKEVTQAATEAAQPNRQLTTLKTLADGLTAKSTALDQQRDAVNGAASEVGKHRERRGEADAKIGGQEASAKGLGELESRVGEWKDLHAEVLARSTEITANHTAVKEADDELRARLGALRDDVQRAVKRFELENQGLDAVGQRIVDLRGSLTAMEGRFKSLEESSRGITEVRSKADALTTQLDGLAENVALLGTQAERVRAMETSTTRLGSTVDEMTQRVAQLEKSRAGVQAALQDVAMLRGTHESVRGALEQVEGAADEMARVLEQQSGTKAWLTGVTEQIKGLRVELAAIEDLKPTVESVRGEADHLSQAMGQIEARSRMVDDLNKRLSELTTLGSQLDERSRELLGRMQGADERFGALAARADEAARIEKLVPAAVATVERAERRVGEVDSAVTGLESRAHNIEGLAERTRALGQELELKQTALDKATEHLDRVAQLREQAASAAQQLEERSGQLNGAVSTAGNRLIELTATLDELDNRAGTLRFAQKRMAQFEERLAKWEAGESQLTRALEQMSQRQTTVDAMQADMHRLYEVAEKTTDDVRAIAAAKKEKGETRPKLQTGLSMVTHVHDAANGLDHRKRQVEQAEERLARAEAMLSEVQAGMERLSGQKALLDQAVTQASALEFHTKQAETVIAALRQEREITDTVRSAVTQLREERRCRAPPELTKAPRRCT